MLDRPIPLPIQWLAVLVYFAMLLGFLLWWGSTHAIQGPEIPPCYERHGSTRDEIGRCDIPIPEPYD